MKDYIQYDRVDAEKHRREAFQKLVGKRVRKIRKQKKWTQEMLAQEAQINDKYVYSIEIGKACMSIWVLMKIAHVLEVGVEELLAAEIDEEETS